MYALVALWGQISSSSCAVMQRGMLFTNIGSKLNNVSSINAVFQYLRSSSMKLWTFAPIRPSTFGDKIIGECFWGSHLSLQILTDFPSPILHISPTLYNISSFYDALPCIGCRTWTCGFHDRTKWEKFCFKN